MQALGVGVDPRLHWLLPPPPPTDEEPLHIANVTSSSLKLHWSNPEPKLFVYFEVTLTRLRDHVVILKTNVSGTELMVGELDSAQTYHAVVTAHTEDGQIVSTRKGIMTTSESLNTPPPPNDLLPLLSD